MNDSFSKIEKYNEVAKLEMRFDIEKKRLKSQNKNSLGIHLLLVHFY